MIFPTIHLNGTNKEDLFNGYLEAIKAVQDAQRAIGRIEFNARDYYVQGDHAWEQARNERRVELIKLGEVEAHLTQIAINIDRQGGK